MDGLVVPAVVATERSVLLLMVFLLRMDNTTLLLRNVLSALTKKKSVVEQPVVTVTDKLLSVNAKMDGLEVLAVTATVVSELLDTTSHLALLPAQPLTQLLPSSALFALTERPSVVEHLVELVTKKLANVFVKLVILVVLAVISVEESVLLLTKLENLLQETQPTININVQFALTEKQSVEDLNVEIATVELVLVNVLMVFLAVLAVDVTVKLESLLTIALL